MTRASRKVARTLAQPGEGLSATLEVLRADLLHSFLDSRACKNGSQVVGLAWG